jgi:hypothetical protein
VTRVVKVAHGWLAQRFPPSVGTTAEAQCDRKSRLLSRGLTALALVALSLDGEIRRAAVRSRVHAVLPSKARGG